MYAALRTSYVRKYFSFPRGSPLVANVSRAILNVTEDDIMINIARKWFGDRATCPASGVGDTVSSSRLDFWRFGGLFLITGTLSILSLLLYIGIFIWKEWHDLRASAINSEDRGGSIWDKMRSWARYYDRFKDDSSVITQNEKRELELSCKNAVNNDDGLLHRSGALSISDVSAANFSSPERMVVSYS